MIDFIPFLSFVLITSITPGPNNISAMAFSMQQGYRKTLPYILGIVSGTSFVLLLCAFLAFGLSSIIPNVVVYTKYIGASYILFLAYKTVRMNLESKAKEGVHTRFVDGALLQLVNPKAVFFGLTIFTTFLNEIIVHPWYMLMAVLGFAINVFLMVSVWALFGAGIQKYLKNLLVKRIFTLIMAAGLVYAAIDIILN